MTRSSVLFPVVSGSKVEHTLLSEIFTANVSCVLFQGGVAVLARSPPDMLQVIDEINRVCKTYLALIVVDVSQTTYIYRTGPENER